MKAPTGIVRLVCSVVLLFTLPTFAQHPAPKPAPLTAGDKQLALRGQLARDPHDREAHKELVALLRKSYAFRTEMEEDGVWLKNNPDDYSAEIEMRSIATTISDPEYAIGIDRFVLAHANRADYPSGYDSVGDRLAFLLLGRGQYAEALALLKRAAELSPADAGVWENLGDGQVRAGQYASAVASYKKSLDLDGNQEGTHEGLALAFLKQEDFGDSATELTAAIAVYNAQYHGNAPTDSWHLMIKNIHKATNAKSDPGLGTLHLKLAKTLLADKKFDRALADVDTALKLDDNFSNYYLKAEIYDAAGEPEKAAATREEARLAIVKMMKSEPPSKDEFSQGLSYPQEIFIMSADSNVVDTAREFIVLLEPTVSKGTLKALDRQFLGMSYCAKGRLPECKKQMNLAFQVGGKWNNATTQYGYAKALQENHDTSEAVEHFQRAYELEPQNVTYRTDYEASKPE